jgi:thiol-disulfide isomerase/thioredoxin
LGRANSGFKEFPKEVGIKVTDPEGKPVAGASVFQFMSLMENREKKDAKREWQFYDAVTTATDGSTKLQYAKLNARPICARLTIQKLTGITSISPFGLLKASIEVVLQPEARLSGTIVSDDLKKAGKPIGWTNAYLDFHGSRFASCDSSTGSFEFMVPAGTYSIFAFGSDVRSKTVSVTVPGGRSEVTADPIVLSASRLILLQGNPAPELEGIVGWKGAKTALSSLRGKYVLLEYWGYWCGPCIGSMPMLLELHEKFNDKGLAIIGVHLDMDGEVDTAAKLDEKLVDIRKRLWNGRDLPFPVALASGKRVDDGQGDQLRGGPASQYGIMSYPTTVLIDPEGKVIGKFAARDAKAAVAAVEKMLKEKK